MPAAPAASCALCIGRTHTSKRVHRNHPAFPHAMVLTVSFVLSPVTGLFCHRHPRIKVLSKPGRADLTSANLTPASGRQDHTTSPSATTSLVRSLRDRSQAFRLALQPHRAQNAAASTASLPASVTIMIRPSGGVGWHEFVEMICPTGEAKYFCKGDSTEKCPTGKSPEHVPLVSRTRCSVLHAAPQSRDLHSRPSITMDPGLRPTTPQVIARRRRA
jgi:hypothetical protein